MIQRLGHGRHANAIAICLDHARHMNARTNYLLYLSIILCQSMAINGQNAARAHITRIAYHSVFTKLISTVQMTESARILGMSNSPLAGDQAAPSPGIWSNDLQS